MNSKVITIKDISGGDKVRLRNGRVITVFDIRNDYVLASYDQWFHVSHVAEIVEKYKTGNYK